MKRVLKKTTVAVLIVTLLFTATGCTTYNNFKDTFFPTERISNESTIKIGIYESLTGVNSSIGKEEMQGIELAHKLYPEVLGKKVELTTVDNQSNIYSAETAIQELISHEPSVILGSAGEVVTLLAGDYVSAASIPAITMTSTNPLITANNAFYFNMTFAEEKQADALAEFICESFKKPEAVTVGVANDDTTTPILKRFRNKMVAYSKDNNCIKGRFAISAGTTNYETVIEKIKATGCKVIYLALQPASAQEFMKQAKELGLGNAFFVGDRSWNDNDFQTFVKLNDYRIIYPSDFNEEASTKTADVFVKAYKEKYGENAEPTEATALGFDAYVLALKGIEDGQKIVEKTTEKTLKKEFETDAAYMAAVEELAIMKETGVPNGKMIKKALLKVKNFEGASGKITYAGTSEAKKSITVNYVTKGELAKTYVVD